MECIPQSVRDAVSLNILKKSLKASLQFLSNFTCIQSAIKMFIFASQFSNILFNSDTVLGLNRVLSNCSSSSLLFQHWPTPHVTCSTVHLTLSGFPSVQNQGYLFIYPSKN